MKTNQGWIRVLSAVLLVLAVQLCSFGQTLPDEVRIDYASLNKPLSLVLKEIAQKSKVNINFSESRIPANKKINISVQDETVGDILTVILREVGFTYQIIGNQLILLKDDARGKDQFLTISGYVKDKVSGENLIYANVYLFDKSKGTQTNEDGFYTITLARGVQRLYYSYIGYQQEVKEYFLDEDVEEDILLNPDVLLNEVVILEEVENREEETTSSENNLYLDKILTASTLGGESDIIRLINMTPGVNSGADGLGGMNIRGGSADQNLVLLDGTPVYNTGHALGLFSVFNSDVIKNAKLIKGNIPARYGGRLSSVLDVRTRDGNTNRIAGGVSLSTLAVKGFVEGPLGKNGSTFLVSGRRTFLDPWIKSLTEYINELNDKEGFSTYFFSDVNAKANLKLNSKNTLQISGFVARDRFDNTVRDARVLDNVNIVDDNGVNWDWGNNMLSVKLKSQLSQKAFSTFGVYYTDFSFRSFDYDSFSSESAADSTFAYKASLFNSGIQDLNASYDIDFVPNTSHRIRAGVNYTRHIFTPGLTNISTQSGLFSKGDDFLPEVVEAASERPSLAGSEIVAYLEDDITLSYSTRFNIGVHTNYTLTGEESYLNVQPRIAFLTQGDNLFFKAGASRMAQYLHLLSNNGLGLPSDVWIPSTDNIAPETSWIFSAGIGYKNKQGYKWGVESYYKIFDDLTSVKEGATDNIEVGSNWENLVPIGTGTSYGIEFYFDRIIGRTTWNANYTLSFSDRTFPDLNRGETYAFRYDRTHNAKLGFFHKVTDNTEFVLNWNFSSGNPITYPDQVVVDLDGQIVPLYFEKNNRRLPVYHRLDVGFNFYSKLKWARQKFSLGLYNAFGRRNAFFIDITSSRTVPGKLEESTFSILPVWPAIAYSLSF